MPRKTNRKARACLVPSPPPKPRPDGRCVECGRHQAITRDKLLCWNCLRAWIKRTTPLPGKWHGGEQVAGDVSGFAAYPVEGSE